MHSATRVAELARAQPIAAVVHLAALDSTTRR